MTTLRGHPLTAEHAYHLPDFNLRPQAADVWGVFNFLLPKVKSLRLAALIVGAAAAAAIILGFFRDWRIAVAATTVLVLAMPISRAISSLYSGQPKGIIGIAGAVLLFYSVLLIMAFGVVLFIAAIPHFINVDAHPAGEPPRKAELPSQSTRSMSSQESPPPTAPQLSKADSNPARTASEPEPGLKSLDLTIYQRVAGTPPAGTSAFPVQPTVYKLVDGGNERNLQEIEPLRIGKDSAEMGPDRFRLEGVFDRPTRWWLIYVDTRGKAAVEAFSESETDGFVFPAPEHDAATGARIDLGAPFSPDEEPGTHCLCLVTGSLPTPKNELEDRLKWIGRPPQDLHGRWAFDVRGFGERTDVRSPQERYTQALKQRLPTGLRPVYALFLRTRQP